ncbi:CPBP family intramembrane glutamic endopeptidase [Altererythrobacter sp. MF3-039]|uniref:CPBP family intramembrane glutamic endopeptidase n=1 Tax=Altererythrobacter sp. MF3-039 TaxID=3252901 RepID=UPI00390C7BBF
MTDQPAPQRSFWRKIWEFPLVALIVALVLAMLCAAAVSVFNAQLLQPKIAEPWPTIISSIGIVVLSIAVYKLAIRKLGAKKHDDLPFGPALKDTALGFAGGGVLISICVGLAALTGVYTISGEGQGTDLVMIVFVAGIYAGFFEELLLRGIVFRWLEEMLGSWIALALSSLMFGFLHAGNDNATFFSSLAISIEAGILLGAAYMLTRNLWLAIGLHAGWNVIQGLWDVPISGNDVDGLVQARLEGPEVLAGGGFGLEATIFALVVATGAGIWMLVRAARAGRIVKPMWSRKGNPITAY